ncbi:hypothetical protein SAMN05880561_103235 [Rhizobium sp. RU33A]|uniref:DUF2218 domain-containing protein n=1 Tax=Rhizobium sp. RU33A TaxID=1907413 RepID=UPI0009553EE7|nr:DUF2218 domain-containing protein [Rhizobium sp. RU33A]SIQ50164.1 hypothetical protein SAMN05880561_103235 [Rhizobium sp. RU33A]
MAQSTTTVPTENGWKYLQQLCKHWAHKLDVELDEENHKAVVKFPEAKASMQSDASSLSVLIETDDPDKLETYQGVVASHLDRFAFREAPLPFDWKAA